MQYSNAGIELTKHFEGCRLEAYQDEAGVWTIGYGLAHGVKAGDVITQERAEEELRQEIEICEAQVGSLIRKPVCQGQFDALVDFCYNLGAFSLQKSMLRQKLNAGDYEGAAAEFPKWNKVRVNGVLQVSPGLTRRRLAEQAMFLGQDWKEERK